MTNYNERLFEIIRKLCHDFENRKVDSLQAQVDAKAAISSLMKELVAEAKPKHIDNSVLPYGDTQYNRAIDEFKQNLLKELEEK